MLINGTIHFTQTETECIENAFRYLAKMYPQSISADSLAAEVGIDVKTLQEGFKRKTTFTIHNYQLIKKVENAMSDLQNIELPIKTITYRHGFKDSSHFGKVFKKLTGKTPMEYRLQALD